MKKLILSLIIIITTVSMIVAQDVLGGEIYINPPFNDNNITVKLYTWAPMNVQRPFVKLQDLPTSYIPIYKIKDTLITPQIRMCLYQGLHQGFGGSSASFFVADSIKTDLIKNFNTTKEYIPIYIISNLIYSTTLHWSDSPVCYEDVNSLQYVNQGHVQFPISCYDSLPNASLTYSLERELYFTIDTNEYWIPNDIQIGENTGLIDWTNISQQDTGLYLFNVELLKTEGTLGNFVKKIVPIHLTSNILSSKNNLEKLNYLQVFPNPTTNYLTIKFDYFAPKDTKIEIFDIVGRRVHYQLMEQQNEQISLAHFTNGVYVVRVRSGEEIWTKKVIKQ